MVTNKDLQNLIKHVEHMVDMKIKNYNDSILKKIDVVANEYSINTESSMLIETIRNIFIPIVDLKKLEEEYVHKNILDIIYKLKTKGSINNCEGDEFGIVYISCAFINNYSIIRTMAADWGVCEREINKLIESQSFKSSDYISYMTNKKNEIKIVSLDSIKNHITESLKDSFSFGHSPKFN